MNLAASAPMDRPAPARPNLLARLRGDVVCVLQRDPAARNVFEIALLYPGVHALLIYRIANSLWRRGLKFPARFLSWFGRSPISIFIPAPRSAIGCSSIMARAS